MNATRGKILVIRGGAIGDFVLTLPVLSALRRQFPETHIEVLGYPHIAQLALAGGLADRVQPIEARPLAGFFARSGELAKNVADYFSSFDIIVSYLFDPDRIFQDNVARCSSAQFIAGPHRPDDQLKVHATEVYLRPLERLAIFNPDPVPHLSVTPQPQSCDELVLHPGSGSERKNWPESNWARLIREVVDVRAQRVLLVGGEAERDRVARLASGLSPDRCHVAQNLPLGELARRLAQCRGFVGHDSGISHLSAALGLPGLVLWGDTVEDVWRPHSDRVRVLREPGGLATISIPRVLEALREMALLPSFGPLESD